MKAEAMDDTKKILAAEHMCDLALNMLNAQTKQSGLEFSKEVSMLFLEKFVSLLVYKTLAESSDGEGRPKAKYEKASSAFNLMKHDTQEAIALAFGAGMYAFTGREVEYYCKLIAIGDPINKEAC